MFKKSFKHLKIGSKILIFLLTISVVAEISVAVLAFVSIKNLSENSINETSYMGENISKSSENALENQSKSYLKEVSESMAKASDAVFEEISDNVLQLCIASENIYSDSENFSKSTIPLPETTKSSERANRTEAEIKAYAIDPQNSSQSKETFLAYSTGKNENLYETNLEKWSGLTSEEQNEIKNNKTVVSESIVPEQIKKEMSTLANTLYISKPVYESNVAVSSVYFGTESGICCYYSSNNSPERYDARIRPWYKDAVSAKKSGSETPVWQSTYTDKTSGVLCITCSKAFCDKKGNILGVAAIDMYLDDISEYIIGEDIAGTGYSFVLDKNGMIIMHPDYKSGEYNSLKSSPLEDENSSESYKSLISAMKNSENGVQNAEIGGKEYYVAYSKLSTPSWCLAVASESDKILAPSKEILNFIASCVSAAKSDLNSDLIKTSAKFLIVFVFLAALICALGIYLTREILKPIKQLKNQALVIGNGDFTAEIPVESKDELGELSECFNKMAQNLKKYVEDLKTTTAEKEKIHSELMIANKIQTGMLPCIFPAFPDRKDFDIYALMDPAKEVGGDFYDFFFTDKEHLALVIADVSGKGVSAALFMVIAKILLKNQLQLKDSPAKVLEIVNNCLCENNEAGMFVTAFIGIVNINTGEFTFSNAGHNPPLIYKKAEDSYELITEPHGFVLGGVPKMSYSESSTFLKKEDLIFLYTDGVTEAMNAQGKLFSKEKLQKILNRKNVKKLSIKEMITHLRKEIDNFSQGAERSDDITMLAFKDFDIPRESSCE